MLHTALFITKTRMEEGSIKKMHVPFAQVPNELLVSTTLSGTAKAVWAYMQSKPEGWQFSVARIAQEFKESRGTLLTAINSLIKEGWLDRNKLQSGRMDYTMKIPEYKIRTVGNSHRGKTGPISKKDTNSNKDTNTLPQRKAGGKEATFKKEGAEIIEAFIAVNPACKRMYGSPPQRRACDDLIDSYGLEQVLKVIAILPKTNTIPYVPTITTPLQLRDKWTSLEAAMRKKKSEHEATNEKYKVAFT